MGVDLFIQFFFMCTSVHDEGGETGELKKWLFPKHTMFETQEHVTKGPNPPLEHSGCYLFLQRENIGMSDHIRKRIQPSASSETL